MATTSPESATRSMEDRKTSILVRFTGAPSVTPEQYDETSRRLEKAGDWPPKGNIAAELGVRVLVRSPAERRTCAHHPADSLSPAKA